MAEQKERLVNRLAEIEQEKTETEAEIEQIKSDKDAVQARLDKLTAHLSELRLVRTELTGHQRYVQTDLTRLSNEKSELGKEISTLQFLMEQKEETASKVDIAVLEEQLTQAIQEKTALNQANIRYQFELDDLEGQAEDLTSHLEQARQKNEDLIRSQAKAEAEKDKIADVLRRLLTNLTDDYQISFDEASKQARPLENLAVSEIKVKDLEKAIRALGPVNLDAVEQFEEVSQRLHFLNTQRDDVLSAKNLLLGTIEEMNDEVKDRFKSTFEAIRESFKVTFRQMFGGGSADLILTEGDLLIAGVEISVQPPGKKIQSLNLMSGGEKALSALALLFSIIRVKTIPFVILDEVEAALDEANVKRFGDYLNRFDKDSQEALSLSRLLAKQVFLKALFKRHLNSLAPIISKVINIFRICLADFLGSLFTCAINFPRRGGRTFKVGSWSGFACSNLRLHSLTGTSVAPRQCHCSVSTSLLKVVTEY